MRADLLFVSNQVSWLDILALGGAARSAFVSKAEVGTTPLVGWLADQNHHLCPARGEARDPQSGERASRCARAGPPGDAVSRRDDRPRRRAAAVPRLAAPGGHPDAAAAARPAGAARLWTG